MNELSPASCYGINWLGVSFPPEFLSPGMSSWPQIRLRQTTSPMDEEALEGDTVTGLVSGGSLHIRRETRQATYHVPHLLDPEELLHPYLAPAGYAFSTWFGREAYHAGAFAVSGGACAVVAEREGGKSTTLAWLAAIGHDVLCDDLLVIEDGTVLPGPRCVDLREAAASRLGMGRALQSVRPGGRWRLSLGATEPVPLKSWLFLRWGPRIEVQPLTPTMRLSLIMQLGRPADPVAPLALAAAPAWQLTRPKRWDSLAPALERLFEVGAFP